MTGDDTSRRTRIGIDVPASRHWAEQTAGYIGALDGPYHRHRLAMIQRVAGNVVQPGSACLDFGCGDGIFAETLSAEGASVVGVDIDPQMIAAARQRFADRSLSVSFDVGGVEAFARLADGSTDVVFALNVVAYLTPDEDDLFYRECFRILRPGGHLIVTHSNELFDMFTLNRYTVDFFRRNFGTADATVDVTGLLTRPDVPDRKTFSIRENPLSYGHKLARSGFREEAQEFASLHPLPPLLMDDWRPDDINAREYADTLDRPAGERWKLMFQCSMFGSRAVKAG